MKNQQSLDLTLHIVNNNDIEELEIMVENLRDENIDAEQAANNLVNWIEGIKTNGISVSIPITFEISGGTK